MIQVQSPVVSARRVSPGLALLHLQAPDIAARARAGQFVLVRCSDGEDPYLRRPFPLFGIGTPQIALLVRADEPGRRWLANRPPGQVVDVLGPLGQGFVLESDTRRLLLVAEGMGVTALAAVAAAAIAAGTAVTLVAGAPTAATALPADLLPAEVEYQLATADGSRGARGAVASLLPDVIQWADQVFASGSSALYRSVAAAITRYRIIVGDDFAQVWLLGPVACGAGACLCCTVETQRGRVLSCREGPVFRLKELALDADANHRPARPQPGAA